MTNKFTLETDIIFIAFDILLIAIGIVSNTWWFLRDIGTFLLGATIVQFIKDYKKHKERDPLKFDFM